MTTQPSPSRGLTVGAGIAVGAPLGLLFGLLLSADPIWSLSLGVVAGLLIGAIIDAQRSRDR